MERLLLTISEIATQWHVPDKVRHLPYGTRTGHHRESWIFEITRPQVPGGCAMRCIAARKGHQFAGKEVAPLIEPEPFEIWLRCSGELAKEFIGRHLSSL